MVIAPPSKKLTPQEHSSLEDEVSARDKRIALLERAITERDIRIDELLEQLTKSESSSWRMTLLGMARSHIKHHRVWAVKQLAYVALTKGPAAAWRLYNGRRLLISSGAFDAEYYRRQYPDVASARIDLALHYLLRGAKEGRHPNALFDGEWYLRQNPDVAAAGVNPFVHYIRFGSAQGRLPQRRPGHLDDIGAVTARTIPDEINPVIQLPTGAFGHTINFEKTAVLVHIYYPELTQEIVGYLENIPIPFGLYITTDSPEKRAAIQAELSQLNVAALETEIRITPNRGRDIAPKYIGFRDVYDRYECFLHLHSKKSLHTQGHGNTWRTYLLKTLLGSKDIAISNLQILSSDNVGIVYPEHEKDVKALINWGYDFPLAKNLLQRLGIKLDAQSILEFPSGSMFWGRSSAIRPLLELGLQFNDFPEEKGQIDGTLAHAIERSLLYIVERAGFSWVRVTTQKSDISARANSPKQVFRPLLGSENYIAGITEGRIPESYRILCRPDCCKKVRLNLILPSVNSAEVFGGIATALSIFKELERACTTDVDVRVIVTDSGIKDITDGLSDYSAQKIGAEYPARRVLLDATQRRDNPLEVRPNDVFVATAWWTALNAYRLHDYQSMIFGSAPKVVYLIQDFEPDFYGWSARYALAESTYLRGQDTIALINSEELCQYFQPRYPHAHSLVIPYRINPNIDRALKESARERILLFYSRISARRNCLETGIDGLTLWMRRNPHQAADWKICCIGERFEPRLVSALPNVTITGKLSLDEYASLLSRASVGLSLMISPHPSYPPLEMAYAGLRTVTNQYADKDLTLRSPLISSIQIPVPELVAQAVEAQVNFAEAEMIGKVTPVRNQTLDIPCNTPYFNARKVLDLLDLS